MEGVIVIDLLGEFVGVIDKLIEFVKDIDCD